MSNKKATFVLEIHYQDHSSWQGKVFWVNENKKQSFRSALELIRLIDKATDPNEVREFADRIEEIA